MGCPVATMQLLPLALKYAFESWHNCPSVFAFRDHPYVINYNPVTRELVSKRHRLAKLASVNKPHKSPQPLALQRRPLLLARMPISPAIRIRLLSAPIRTSMGLRECQVNLPRHAANNLHRLIGTLHDRLVSGVVPVEPASRPLPPRLSSPGGVADRRRWSPSARTHRGRHPARSGRPRGARRKVTCVMAFLNVLGRSETSLGN